MPAVLLEAGSIVNRDEELLLATPEYQSLISAAVTDAVEIFARHECREILLDARALEAPPAIAPMSDSGQTRSSGCHRDTSA